MDDVRTTFHWLATSAIFVFSILLLNPLTQQTEAQSSKPIRVSVVDRAGFDKVIAANKGKVVVVDCWATWCLTCREGFPKMVELSKNYASKDVVVVSLSFDDLEKGEAPAKVKKFLEENGGRIEHLISSLNIGKDGAEAFEIPDGMLPHCKVYGRDGKLVKALESSEDGELKHEDIEAVVQSAIKASNK